MSEGIDLSFAREALADLVLIDEGTVTHTVRLDEPLDGAGVRPTDTTTIYSGPLAIKPRNSGATDPVDESGGRVDPDAAYIVTFPHDAPAIPWGATLEVTAAVHDAQLVGRRFQLRQAALTTLLVSRKVTARELPA